MVYDYEFEEKPIYYPVHIDRHNIITLQSIVRVHIKTHRRAVFPQSNLSLFVLDEKCNYGCLNRAKTAIFWTYRGDTLCQMPNEIHIYYHMAFM